MISSKRLLQLAVIIGSLVPIGAGLAGIVSGPGMVGGMESLPIPLDSHFRYLSGLLLGIGICFLTTVSGIEYKTIQFRMLAFIVVTGGMGRLWSLWATGMPGTPMMLGLGMELLVMPFLVFWQYKVAQRSILTSLEE